MNKKLVNDILYYKLIQQNRYEAATYTKQTNLCSQLDLVTASQTISNDTINNFKALNKQLGIAPSLAIDYNTLNERLTDKRHAPKQLFDFTADLKKIKEEKRRFLVRENELISKFQALTMEVRKNKDLQQEIRSSTYTRMSEIKDLQSNVYIAIIQPI